MSPQNIEKNTQQNEQVSLPQMIAGKVGETAQFAQQTVGQVTGGIVDKAVEIGDGIQNTAGGVASAVGGKINEIRGVENKTGEELKRDAEVAEVKTENAVKSQIDRFNEINAEVKESAVANKEGLQSAIVDGACEAQKQVQEGVEFAQGWTADRVNDLGNALPLGQSSDDTTKNVKETMDKTGSQVMNKAGEVQEGIKSVASDAADGVAEQRRDLEEKGAGEKFEELRVSVADKVSAVCEEKQAQIAEQSENMQKATQENADAARSWAADRAGDAKDVIQPDGSSNTKDVNDDTLLGQAQKATQENTEFARGWAADRADDTKQVLEPGTGVNAFDKAQEATEVAGSYLSSVTSGKDNKDEMRS